MTTVAANRISQCHIGQRVEALACLDGDERQSVTGLLRWFTMTSDTVVLAVEECIEDPDGDGAVEWEFANDDVVTVR